MIYALVKIGRGIIDEVLFYFEEKEALKAMDVVAKTMNPEHDDAAVFGPDGMVVNAKNFLDESDRYDGNIIEHLLKSADENKPIYIIGNPIHFLGFMVASPDEPMGYRNPAEAISDLGQMRKDFGKHLKLYRVIPVEGSIIQKEKIDKYNAENEVEDFEYSLIEEHLA